jgi:surfeit locus 1 family protein
MSYLQFRNSNYIFRPTWLGTLLTILCIPVFIKLGLWQYHKAEQKQALQALFDSYSHAGPVQLPSAIADPAQWRYRQVEVAGKFEPRYQILLDNQVENTQVGYHVITPLQLKSSNRYVLIDRGWIPAQANHCDLPVFDTPAGEQKIVGQVWIPSPKFYSLETSEQQKNRQWQALWQNMDMKRYATSVPFEVLPVVIRLDAQSSAGGFSRDWPKPAERIETNLGYAYQWFGFAVAAVVIYLVVSFKKLNSNESSTHANTK